MDHIVHVIAGNPILLTIVIVMIAVVAYALVKRLAKLALFVVILLVVAYLVLHHFGRM